MVHDSPGTLEVCGEHMLHVTRDVKKESNRLDRLHRAQWLGAAILGANDGSLSTTSLMIGIGAAQEGQRFMILSGVAGAIAGACSMAAGEFVSVSTQRDIELHPLKENINLQEIKIEIPKKSRAIVESGSISPVVKVTLTDTREKIKEGLPNPYKAGAMSVNDYTARLVVVTSIALVLFGGIGAVVDESCVRASATRVLVGGWISMAITYDY